MTHYITNNDKWLNDGVHPTPNGWESMWRTPSLGPLGLPQIGRLSEVHLRYCRKFIENQHCFAMILKGIPSLTSTQESHPHHLNVYRFAHEEKWIASLGEKLQET